MRVFIVIAVLLGASNASRAEVVHYVDHVNTAKSSITSFAVAAPGSNEFRELPLGKPLQGGGDSTTIAIRKDDTGCQRDLRTTFADGRVLIQRNFDVCKNRSDHVGQYLRGHTKGRNP